MQQDFEIPIGMYRHYKGNNYEVLGICRHSETLEKLVVYRALYESEFPYGSFWVRPLAMFCEKIDVDGQVQPRFKYIGK